MPAGMGMDGRMATLPDVASPPDLHHEPPFPLEGGHRPSLEEAKAFTDRYESFKAVENAGIDTLRAEGYLTGAGTTKDPYVIDHVYVAGDLTLESLDRALILRNAYVAGTLRLNYVGERLYVHHVYAGDLRVNENVKRSGPTTGGLFHDDAFAFVGQIRHFVGEFRNNEVGPKPEGAVAEFLGDSGVARVDASVVFNLDGFHRADVHHNTFVGAVTVKLHGHNHADCLTCLVHDHENATLDEQRMAGHDHGAALNASLGFRTHHSIRFTSLLFRDNEIRVRAGVVALTYDDRDHAGDDRTANSEPNASLDDPHVHYQDVTFARNRLVGGGFVVDIFNAPDDHHPIPDEGVLRVLDNDATVAYAPTVRGSGPSQRDAYLVSAAKGIHLLVRGNTARFEVHREGAGALVPLDVLDQPVELTGFRLRGVGDGALAFEGNRVEEGTYGVFAETLAKDVTWRLVGNAFATEHAWRGRDVANPPSES